MKMVLCAACAGVVLAAIPAAGATQGEVVVRPDAVSMKNWSGRVSRDLERNLAYPRMGPAGFDPEGVVRVDFRCSEDGRPTDATVARRSGQRRLDLAALRAVARIRTMHPLPAGIGPDQRYAAVVVFARTEESRDRELAAFGEETRLAQAGPGGRAVASVGLAPPAG